MFSPLSPVHARHKSEDNRSRSKVVCGYPLSIFFIVVNEFCERFSYYGMRAVLVLYFTYFLGWDDDLATSIYHTFVALCYLTPILGAIVADSWLGKFKTIIYLSIVYAIGQIAMAISAVHDITDTDKNGTPNDMTFHVALSMVGLFLIALGTGGIKPCVAAFGGDQFNENQEGQRRTFFSVFYLCINGGSLLSTIITPILRGRYEKNLKWQHQKCKDSAYTLPMYFKAKPQGNIMLDVCKCITFAIKNRYRHRSKRYPKRVHWMDWAEEKYDKLLIAQIKMVLKVLLLYTPLPMFWTLFDQKGSRWTLQATTMNGDFGLLVIQPDQMQTFNPILILTLVPIMDSVIYPLIKKCGLNFTPLKRMTVGMVLAAVAFGCAALVQLEIDVSKKISSHTMINFKLTIKINTGFAGTNGVDKNELTCAFHYFSENVAHLPVISLVMGLRHTLLIPSNITAQYLLTDDLISKPEKGRNAVRFVNGLSTKMDLSISAVGSALIHSSHFSNHTLIKNGKTNFTIKTDTQSCEFSREFGFGSSYTFFIPSNFSFGQNCLDSITVMEYIKPNTAHMALQIPQYFFITAGEVMFSVTGLEFSYSQAPNNMKAVLQAGWLLTVAVGNFIVLIVAEVAKIPKKWAEYVLFASLLLVVCVIFSIMAHFYTYIDPAEIEAQFKKNCFFFVTKSAAKSNLLESYSNYPCVYSVTLQYFFFQCELLFFFTQAFHAKDCCA
uniref:Uncharacterized protein n=1 Tax=Mola mola TaxID=94237 RepID=A0A3Q3XJ65_MOLML